MSIALVVTRLDAAITLSDWTGLVDEDDDLRLRVQPYEALNPRTGEKISVKAGEADTEIQINGQCFLSFASGMEILRRSILDNLMTRRTPCALRLPP